MICHTKKHLTASSMSKGSVRFQLVRNILFAGRYSSLIFLDEQVTTVEWWVSSEHLSLEARGSLISTEKYNSHSLQKFGPTNRVELCWGRREEQEVKKQLFSILEGENILRIEMVLFPTVFHLHSSFCLTLTWLPVVPPSSYLLHLQ